MASVDELVTRSGGLTQLPVWQTLLDAAGGTKAAGLGERLDQAGRYADFSLEFSDLVLDFSRNNIGKEELALLLKLAESRELVSWREALFSGQLVNNTEHRAALHMALRAPASADFTLGGEELMPAVCAERARVMQLAGQIRSGEFHGYTGAPITDIVNLGIGGSDLGLVMVSEALKPLQAASLRLHFVSNVDGSELADTLAAIDPAQTLFIICSKSFATLETQLNANAARDWLLAHLPAEALARHFVAVSVNESAMDSFGISPELRFPIWDWVGGRYSLWSSVGLAIAIGIGPDAFSELLAGAAELDAHFCEADLAQNLPVILALLTIWNQNLLGIQNHAVLPYSQRLHRLPAFLQQLEMESNGKSVTRQGEAVGWSTGQLIWGEPGSNAQHSFFQLLHQGTLKTSLDLIAVVRGGFDAEHQCQALANALAQAEAFARGRGSEAVAAELRDSGLSTRQIEELLPHKLHPGGRPCNLLLMKELTPRALGQLIALYEHKVFVQSVIWGINPFDQWGVELGKRMAVEVASALKARDARALPGIAARIFDWSDA